MKEDICREINKIIDFPPHDVEDRLKEKLLREAFESGMPKDHPIIRLIESGFIGLPEIREFKRID